MASPEGNRLFRPAGLTKRDFKFKSLLNTLTKMLATYFRRLVIRARQASDDRIRELEAGTLQNPERFHFDFTSSVHHDFEIDPAVNA